MKRGQPPGVYLWRDKTYISLQAVAIASGRHISTVSSHLRDHGHLDHLGVGRGRSNRRRAAPKAADMTDRIGRAAA